MAKETNQYWLEVEENGVSTEYVFDTKLELFAALHRNMGKELYFGGPDGAELHNQFIDVCKLLYYKELV